MGRKLSLTLQLLPLEHRSSEDFLSGTAGRYLGGSGGLRVTTLEYGEAEGEAVLRGAGGRPPLFM